MLFATAGLLWLSRVQPGSAYALAVLPGGILSGLGMGLTLGSGTVAAMGGVTRAQTGLASGLLNTSRMFGGALGLASLSTIAAAQTRSDAGAGAAHALTRSFSLAFTVGAVFTLAGALAAFTKLRTRSQLGVAAAEPSSEPEALAA